MSRALVQVPAQSAPAVDDWRLAMRAVQLRIKCTRNGSSGCSSTARFRESCCAATFFCLV